MREVFICSSLLALAAADTGNFEFKKLLSIDNIPLFKFAVLLLEVFENLVKADLPRINLP